MKWVRIKAPKFLIKAPTHSVKGTPTFPKLPLSSPNLIFFSLKNTILPSSPSLPQLSLSPSLLSSLAQLSIPLSSPQLSLPPSQSKPPNSPSNLRIQRRSSTAIPPPVISHFVARWFSTQLLQNLIFDEKLVDLLIVLGGWLDAWFIVIENVERTQRNSIKWFKSKLIKKFHVFFQWVCRLFGL